MSVLRNSFKSFLFTILFAAGCSGAFAQTRDDNWRDDISAFKNNLTGRHIDLFKKLSKSDFDKNIAELTQKIPQLQDYEISIELMRILAKIGDSHTNISPWQAGIFRQYPLQFTVFKDGVFVTAASDERLLKARLVAINSFKIGDVLKKLETLIPHENSQRVKAIVNILLQTPEVLKALSIVGNMESAEFSFEKAGESFTEHIQPQIENIVLKSSLDELGAKIPAYQQNDAAPYWFGYFEDTRTMYVQYNSCVEMPEKSFKNFIDEVFAFAENRGARKFVLDLRNNAGGDSRIIHPMVSALKKSAVFNRRGKLFVIIGEQTFSSAVLNLALLQDNTQALFVGEATGGAPNHFGEVKTFSLPNSALKITYSTKFLKTSQTSANTFSPDIPADRSSSDYFSGRDAALEAILRYKISLR
ncbi:MAG: hypothetical protein V4642_10575 [Bacteroidota bacterium]